MQQLPDAIYLAKRAAFFAARFNELNIKYSVANNQGKPKESGELVIMNYEPQVMGGLF